MTENAATSPIIAEWALNRRERVRVSIEQFNGTWLINIRKWFEADDGALRPGKHGIALAIRHLPRLDEAISKALQSATARDLVRKPQRDDSEGNE